MKLRKLLALAMGCACVAAAQVRQVVPRADGAQVPLMVYGQAMDGGTCRPLAVLSHGAGGSERGLAYLASGLAAKGWFAVVMGHRESGLTALNEDIRQSGQQRAGIQALVMTPPAYAARLGDVTAALAWATAQCKAKQPFRALLGHSMGAETVLLEAGAKQQLGLASSVAGLDRFDAYVAMSPQGAGKIFPDGAWAGIHKPLFDLTGTLDGALNGGPKTRQEVFAGLPASTDQCHWLGVIDGANHASFGGRGPDAERVNSETVAAVTSFLDGARQGKCVLPTPVAGFLLRSKLNHLAQPGNQPAQHIN